MISALVLVCVAQAPATNPLESLLDARTIGKIMARKPLAELIAKTGLHPRVEAGAPAALSPLTATDFKSGPRVLPEQVAGSAGVNAATRRQMVESMNSAIDGFERTQRPHNVAAAVAWLIFSSIDTYTHMLAKLTDAQGDAAVAAINDELAASEVFRKMTLAQKQRLYEMCLTTAAGLLGFQKSNDVEAAQKLAKRVIESYAAAPR